MNTSKPLAGHTFVVTGSSSGIGKAIAIEFAHAGADIVLHGRSRSTNLEEVAHQITEMGQTAHVVLADFEDSAAVLKTADEAFSLAGRVTGWVNNAGGDVLTGSVERTSD